MKHKINRSVQPLLFSGFLLLGCLGSNNKGNYVAMMEQSATQLGRNKDSEIVGIGGSEADGGTLLCEGAKNGDSGRIQNLVEAGVSINAKDKNDKTALIYAAEMGKTDIVKYLVEQRADINIRDAYGKTAVAYAAGNKHKDIVQYLVDEAKKLSGEKEKKKVALKEDTPTTSSAANLTQTEKSFEEKAREFGLFKYRVSLLFGMKGARTIFFQHPEILEMPETLKMFGETDARILKNKMKELFDVEQVAEEFRAYMSLYDQK